MTEMEHKKDTKGILLRLGKYVIAEWPLFLSAVLFTLVSNQLSLLGPKYSGAAIDAIGLSSGTDFSAVWENVIKMAFCYVISAVRPRVGDDSPQPAHRIYHAKTAF